MTFGLALGSGEQLRGRYPERRRERGDLLDRRFALGPLDPADVVAVHARVEPEALLGDVAAFGAQRSDRLTEADEQWISLWHGPAACSLIVSGSTP